MKFFQDFCRPVVQVWVFHEKYRLSSLIMDINFYDLVITIYKISMVILE